MKHLTNREPTFRDDSGYSLTLAHEIPDSVQPVQTVKLPVRGLLLVTVHVVYTETACSSS